MDPKVKDHMDRVLMEAWNAIEEKYTAGQKEHGGYLPEAGVMPLIEFALDEAVDMVVYLLTLKELIKGSTKDRT